MILNEKTKISDIIIGISHKLESKIDKNRLWPQFMKTQEWGYMRRPMDSISDTFIFDYGLIDG